jgi:hypothetical protein
MINGFLFRGQKHFEQVQPMVKRYAIFEIVSIKTSKGQPRPSKGVVRSSKDWATPAKHSIGYRENSKKTMS